LTFQVLKDDRRVLPNIKVILVQKILTSVFMEGKLERKTKMQTWLKAVGVCITVLVVSGLALAGNITSTAVIVILHPGCIQPFLAFDSCNSLVTIAAEQ